MRLPVAFTVLGMLIATPSAMASNSKGPFVYNSDPAKDCTIAALVGWTLDISCTRNDPVGPVDSFFDLAGCYAYDYQQHKLVCQPLHANVANCRAVQFSSDTGGFSAQCAPWHKVIWYTIGDCVHVKPDGNLACRG
jgi:hypothetical protein